jgi:pyruvate ferredoxin oxidoreductase alpha subunit
MVHVDGFHLSHVIEPIYLLEQEKVDKFLPEYTYPYALNVDKPLTMGAFGAPNVYTEAKKAQDTALRDSKDIIRDIWQEFGKVSGRYYAPVEKYKTDDADVLLLIMGSYCETAMIAVDSLRENGEKVGLIRLRLWRPFPFDEFRQAVARSKVLIVFDRALSLGGPSGPVCSEAQSTLYPLETRPKVISFIGGLGGRDVSAATFESMIKLGIQKASRKHIDEFEMIEVRS